MADKQINELPANAAITDETLFPAYQPGATDPAQKVTGAQLSAFAKEAGATAGEQAAGGLAKGATFTPVFDPSTGLLSFTNDLGLPNPDPVQLSGVTAFNGRAGAVVPQAGDYGIDDIEGLSTTLSNKLNKAGDYMTGDLMMNNGRNVVAKGSDGTSLTKFFTYNGIGYIQNEDGSGNRRAIHVYPQSQKDLANAIGLETNESGSSKLYTVLHTGNKPSGSYTGNGDASERQIVTGGIGNAVLVYGAGSSDDAPFIVTPSGAIGKGASTAVALSRTLCRNSNGVLTLATNSGYLNANGATYYYQVL